jgi:hypothetical protein
LPANIDYLAAGRFLHPLAQPIGQLLQGSPD